MKAPILLVALAALVAACGAPPAPAAPASPAPESASAVEPIDGARAHALVKSGARLLDVRTPKEYAAQHIEGAENVPVDGIEGQDMGPKEAPLVVYCQKGARAKRAAEALHAKGYTKVYLLGAMENWDK